MIEVPEDIESLRGFLKGHPEHRPIVPNGPGLGLGGRMGRLASTSAMLAIEKSGIKASAIQSSVFRELAPQSLNDKDVLIDYKGIGKIPVGHTGMTIQGQFVSALQDRIEKNILVPYVADADHIPLRGDTDEHIAEFSSFVREASDRTLFTIDPHFCIHDDEPSPADKFRTALHGIKRACRAISGIKGNSPYAVEVSIDECPGITSVAEMSFFVKELSRRKIKLFSIAPAIGFDKKDKDVSNYQHKHLYKLLKSFYEIVEDNGLLLGIHSGDGKGKNTLQLIAEATNSQVWYKVSPDRQRIFFKAMSESPADSYERQLFEKMSLYLLDVVNQGSRSSEEVLYDFCFLLAKPFKKELACVSEDFVKYYFALDLAYITDLARNLDIL